MVSDISSSSSSIKKMFGCLAIHLKRCIGWRLIGTEPSASEKKKLGSIEDGAMSSYLVWRRSSILVSLPILLYSTIAGFVEVERFRRQEAQGEFPYTTPLGHFLQVLPSFSGAFLFLASIITLFRWHIWHHTSKVLKFGWLFSTLTILVPAFIPFEYTVKSSYEQDYKAECVQEYFDINFCNSQYDLKRWLLRVVVAIWYMIQILPLVLTFPSSAVRGALRIRGLLPDFSLAGWVIMFSAPFHSLLVLVSLVFIIQIVGNFLLVVATILLCIAPWLYLFRRELYVSISSEKKEKKIDVNHKIMMVLVITSVILLIIWAHIETSFGYTPLGSNNEESLVTYNAMFQLIFEGIGRLLITTVVFSDSILVWTVTNCGHENSRREDEITSKRIDMIYHSLEGVLTSPKESTSTMTPEPNDGPGSTPEAEEHVPEPV